MINIHKSLQKAHSFFTDCQYDKANFIYSQLLSLDITNEEYKLYCILCDIGKDDEGKGQSLFDRFIIAKNDNTKDAVKYIMDMIDAYDGNNEKMMSILKDISAQNTQNLDAIKYEDFETLIKQRGSFRIAFEDIMFSTKVAITSRNEFFEFVNQLIDNNFKNIAYSYLDGFNEYFKYDQQIIELYDKLGDKPIDINKK
ncbi:FIG00388415: hypothetical protein [hydrothermal vent metagenome]|uniref:Uncharacterized protein n=1 Tax=hydrothermal vent metagenome TaxID=652676 RepID=A0A3B1E4W5_9ZZZZ